jgi:2-dehydro-3-deoxyphosphogalactonate aldolase
VNSPAEAAPTRLIAILRGLTDRDAAAVGTCLYETGIRALEVPLNSPDPLRTIATLRALLPADCLVGAGTVVTTDQVQRCHDAGAQIIVSPNTNVDVIARTLDLGMQSLPGAATPSEAFTAIAAGATRVKIFPAEQVGIGGLRAWAVVLPPGTGLIPVGGVDESNAAAWLTAGAAGLGIGSSLYTPGIAIDDLRQRAISLITAVTTAPSSARESA